MDEFDDLRAALRAGDLTAAEAAVRALASAPDYAGEALQTLARKVEDVAATLIDSDRATATWAYDRAIVLWHGWGSMATSGGDGTARMRYIKDAYRRRAALLGE